ncbi:hypothetical protein JD844_021407 [Phrynosoma platyrhinos]|uniref:Uncharacterized protein n=1 Tax=Phrynosoma platyrhinos TaxID=52577 RepID=A0ABQ7STK9_PHRPL|nr:hypothetical protein JD844_021407 [Phrynosoma platyrhinos]
MASKKLRRAGLPQDLCERLSRHQITTCQVYEMKRKRTMNPSTAFLPTTLEDLDKILHGGIACGSITEVKDGILLNIYFSLKKTAEVAVDKPKKASKKASSERARSPESRKKLSKRRHSLEKEVLKAKEPAAKKPRVRPEKAKHHLELETEPSLPASSKSPSPVPGPSSALSIPPPLTVVSPLLQALTSESESEGEIRDDIPLLVTEQVPALPKDSANLGTEADEAPLDPETGQFLRENPDLIFDSLTGRFLQHVDPRNLASRSAAPQRYSQL